MDDEGYCSVQMLEGERRIDSAEPHAQGQRVVDLMSGRLVPHPVQVGVDRVVEIARWVQPPGLHLQQGRDDLDGAGGAQTVPDK